MSRSGKKVLLIDLDPQTSATLFLENNYGEITPKEELFTALNNENLRPAICHLAENLDVIPGDWNLSKWDQMAAKFPQKLRMFILGNLLQPIKEKYDYVILDVPPTISVLVTNAVLASDYIALVLQTQKSSYESALRTTRYLQELKEDYNANFILIGIILYLVSKRSKTDNIIESKAAETFGEEALFKNHIYYRERVKNWSNQGITHNEKDIHDVHTHKMYGDLIEELIERIGD